VPIPAPLEPVLLSKCRTSRASSPSLWFHLNQVNPAGAHQIGTIRHDQIGTTRHRQSYGQRGFEIEGEVQHATQIQEVGNARTDKPETGFASGILSARARTVYLRKRGSKGFPRTKNRSGSRILSAEKAGATLRSVVQPSPAGSTLVRRRIKIGWVPIATA